MKSSLCRFFFVVLFGWLGSIAPAMAGTLVMISAENCVPCKRFIAQDFGMMKKMAESKGHLVRMVEVKRFQNYADDPFPADLSFLKQKFKKGTPQFVLLSGKSIQVSAFGRSGYMNKIRHLFE